MKHTPLRCPPSRRGALVLCLHALIGALSLFAVILACATAVRDGYGAFWQRLLYFTQLSNVWVCAVSLAYVVLAVRALRRGVPLPRPLYLLRYIVTVSITLTGIIFCGLLAPFAEFNIWTFSSVLTHVAVPLLSVLVYFLDDLPVSLGRRHGLLCALPPLGYFLFCAVLFYLNVDFGKGEPYPYFFMNLRSEVGWLGARWGGDRPELGTLWWLVLILLLILGIAAAYRAWHPATRARKTGKGA